MAIKNDYGKKCIYCGKVFAPKDPEQKFCSPTHSTSYRKNGGRAKFSGNKSEAKQKSFKKTNFIGRCPTPNKRIYKTMDEAIAAIKEIGNYKLAPYQCNCYLWHLSTDSMASKKHYDEGFYSSQEYEKHTRKRTSHSMRKNFNE